MLAPGLFDISRPGVSGAGIIDHEFDPGEAARCFGPHALRDEPLGLPELSENEVVRHFTSLSRQAYGVDSGPYPLGSCTMKYNPKRNDRLAQLGRLRQGPSPPARGDPAGRVGQLPRDPGLRRRADRDGRGHPAAGRRRPRGVHRTAGHPQAFREAGGAPRPDPDPRLGPRHQPGQRRHGGLHLPHRAHHLRGPDGPGGHGVGPLRSGGGPDAHQPPPPWGSSRGTSSPSPACSTATAPCSTTTGPTSTR